MTQGKVDRNDKILALRKSGLTYKEIAARFGISMQRVRTLCMRVLDPEKYRRERVNK